MTKESNEFDGYEKVACYKCIGQKKIFGMGNMYHDCDTCDGKGYLYKENGSDDSIYQVETKTDKKESFDNNTDYRESTYIEVDELEPIKKKRFRRTKAEMLLDKIER